MLSANLDNPEEPLDLYPISLSFCPSVTIVFVNKRHIVISDADDTLINESSYSGNSKPVQGHP